MKWVYTVDTPLYFTLNNRNYIYKFQILPITKNVLFPYIDYYTNLTAGII